MNAFTTLQQSSSNPARSMGVKLIIVCALALFMSIPAFFVSDLIDERTHRAADVVTDISSNVGGQQTFLGPTLAVPYTYPPQSTNDVPHHGIYFIFPTQADAQISTKTEERHRSLFKVPVFQADLRLDGAFDIAADFPTLPTGTVLDWKSAEILVGVSDARGAQADGTLTAGGKTAILAPANLVTLITTGNNNQGPSLTTFGASAATFAQPGAQFKVSANLRFSGAQHLALLPYGKSTHVTLQGDWPSPGFDGAFLPVSRSVSAGGFQADWSVPFIARGVRAEGNSEILSGLATVPLGVSFVEVADPYQSVNRALKYIPLFLGLLFLTYFIFEITTGKRVHPAQYILVGVAQLIFYLLLLSLAERIGFDFGFLIAGSATVILLASNTGWIFKSRVQAARALFVFALLYSLIYLMLRLEDNALLVGAIASFLAVAATMYFTRTIDWYSPLAPSGAGGAAPGPNAARDSIWH